MTRRLLSQSGITAIEVILIVVIIAILHKMFVPRFSKEAILKHKVYATAHDLASDIRYARRLSIGGGLEGNPITSPGTTTEFPARFWVEVFKSAGASATDSWRVYGFMQGPNDPVKTIEVLSDIEIEDWGTSSIYFDDVGRPIYPAPPSGNYFEVKDTNGNYRWAVSVERNTGYVKLRELQ